MSTVSVVSIMTAVPIASQTPMAKVFGEQSCYIFWAANVIYQWKLITSGLGMAIYRLICFKFLFKRNLNTKKMVRYVLLVQLAVSVTMISVRAFGYAEFGWEKAIHYQFCSDMGSKQVQVLHDYNNEDFNSVLYKTLRFAPVMIGQTLVLAEMLIYVWIIYHLWKHDKENFEDKVITDHMRKERNQKNVITLKGQVYTFVIEIICSRVSAIWSMLEFQSVKLIHFIVW